MQIDTPGLTLLPRYDLFRAARRWPLVRTNPGFKAISTETSRDTIAKT